MTFLNMDAMSVASNCSIIFTPPRGVFFLFKLEGCALKVGGCNPPPGGGVQKYPWLRVVKNYVKPLAQIQRNATDRTDGRTDRIVLSISRFSVLTSDKKVAEPGVRNFAHILHVRIRGQLSVYKLWCRSVKGFGVGRGPVSPSSIGLSRRA